MVNSDSVTATLEPDAVAALGAELVEAFGAELVEAFGAELVDPAPQPAMATRAATATSPRATLIPISFRDRRSSK